MRTLQILFILISVFFTSQSIAQSSLHAFDASSYVTGDTSTLLHSDVKIVNTGANTIYVKVSQDNFSAVPGHVTYFCWGVTCYPPTVTVSPTPVMMAPGDTATSFIGYLQPAGHTGISVVNYNFFNRDDESDSVTVTITYDVVLTGIDEVASKASISDAYPNPANGLTRISYDLKSSNDAKLVFYNLLGSVVKEINLNDQQSTLIISTSGFESGVYYYSIVSNGTILPARKLVVAHR